MISPVMHALVRYCFSVVRKVQIDCWLVLDILISSNSKCDDMKVVDHAVLYVISKFHIFYSCGFLQEKCEAILLLLIGCLVVVLRETMVLAVEVICVLFVSLHEYLV